MAQPQTPDQMAAMVDGIAAKQMGVAPATPPVEAAKPEAKDSSQDKAAEQGSPKTEGDKIGDEAVVYEVAFGENDTRKLTPSQIKGTFERYGAMNHENAQLAPVMKLIKKHMAQTGESPKQMAERMTAMQAAQQKNPTMGNTKGDKSGPPYPKAQTSQDLDGTLSKWEEDNAATLPPGYREMMVGGQGQMQQMQQQMAQMQQAMQQVLASSQGNVQAARAGMEQGQTKQAQAIRQQIGNNLDRVQQTLKLPDDKAQDFMVFAAERGYTMEDFSDVQLTYKLMNDFKNNMDSPEMERMRQIAQRRQAFTGSLGQTPASSPVNDTPAAGSRFDQFADVAMAKKGMATG